MTAHSKEHFTISTLPTAPATAVRLQIYQPSRRPKPMVSDWMVSPWGRCRIDGRLGQRHADLIDVCMYVAEGVHTSSSGRIKLLVDPYKVRQVMGNGTQGSYETIKTLLRDITKAIIEWETPTGSGFGNIIDRVEYSRITKRNPLTNSDRYLLKITMSEDWSKLIYDDIRLRYNPADVIQLQHGITQAVVRVILSHKQGSQPNGLKISTVFGWLGIPEGSTRRKYTYNLREDDSGLINQSRIKNIYCSIFKR